MSKWKTPNFDIVYPGGDLDQFQNLIGCMLD